MTKLVLTIALLVSAANLAIGSYAAVCSSTKGNRYCGTTCTAAADGTCSCSGECTKEERDWVGAGKDDEEELEAELN